MVLLPRDTRRKNKRKERKKLERRNQYDFYDNYTVVSNCVLYLALPR